LLYELFSVTTDHFQRANMAPVGASFTAAGVGGGGILPPSASTVSTQKALSAFHPVGATGHGVVRPQSTMAFTAASGMVLAHFAARCKRARWVRGHLAVERSAGITVSSRATQQDGQGRSESVRRLLLEDQPAQLEDLGDTADKVILPVKVRASELGASDNARADAMSQESVPGRARVELATLQGYWEELHTGLTIKVTNDEVDFHDGRGIRKLTEEAEGLSLQGAVLTGGLPDLAVWRQGDITEYMVWARAPHIEQDPSYNAIFFKFKLHRTILRTQLVSALAAEDYKAAARIQETWQSTWGAGEDTTPQKELRLACGRFFVPGVCVRHKIFKFRAVVVGCEAWIRAPAMKMLSEVKSAAPDTALHRLQPVYWCLVDERDAPGGGCSLALEKDLEIASDAYPVQSPWVERFLAAHDSIQGYLPGVRLKMAMKRQSVGLPFMMGDK